jgi:hypothetical protein
VQNRARNNTEALFFMKGDVTVANHLHALLQFCKLKEDNIFTLLARVTVHKELTH